MSSIEAEHVLVKKQRAADREWQLFPVNNLPLVEINGRRTTMSAYSLLNLEQIAQRWSAKCTNSLDGPVILLEWLITLHL